MDMTRCSKNYRGGGWLTYGSGRSPLNATNSFLHRFEPDWMAGLATAYFGKGKFVMMAGSQVGAHLKRVALAGCALAALSTASYAQSAGTTSNAELRSQVQQLMTLLHTMSEQNQAQIDALATQVKALQAQVSAQPKVVVAAGTSGPPHIVESKTHRFGLESADGQYSIALTGRLHLDAGDYVDVGPRSRYAGPQDLASGFNARRARLGVTGKLFGDWAYTILYDFGNSSDATASGLETAQLAYTGFKNASIEFGYSDTFFTMDEATGSNDIMFMERSVPGNLATGLNAGDNRSNIGGRYWTDRYWLGAYFTGPQSSTGISYTPAQPGAATPCATAPATSPATLSTATCATISDSHLGGERFGAFQRASVQALAGPDYSLHIGADADELLKAPNTGSGTAYTVTLSDRPDLRIDPTSLITTGALGTVKNQVQSAQIYGAELAGGWRSLYAQGEYYHTSVDRLGLSTADFEGAYGQVAWEITGEQKKYNPATGTYPNPVPLHPFSLAEGGYGGFELAGRMDYANLNYDFVSGKTLSSQPNAVDGGRWMGYTLGLNWYPNSSLRFMLNWTHGNYIKANGASSTSTLKTGSQIGTRIDAVAARAQIQW